MITLLNGEKWDESQILKEMDNDPFYYGHLGKHALSSSAMKKLIKSPKAYISSLTEDSNKQPYRDGRLIHLWALEEHRIDELVIIDGTKAKKEFKEATEEYGSHMVYTQSEVNNAKYIAQVVRKNDEAAQLLEGCSFEEPAIKMMWDIPVRGKADARKGKTIIDLKSCTGIEKFHYSAKNFDYDLQAALYLHLFDADEFIFLAVDKDTKDVGIYECSPDFLDSGWQKIERSINNYNEFFMGNPDPRRAVENYTIRGIL